jgi:hypothetical protein
MLKIAIPVFGTRNTVGKLLETYFIGLPKPSLSGTYSHFGYLKYR